MKYPSPLLGIFFALPVFAATAPTSTPPAAPLLVNGANRDLQDYVSSLNAELHDLLDPIVVLNEKGVLEPEQLSHVRRDAVVLHNDLSGLGTSGWFPENTQGSREFRAFLASVDSVLREVGEPTTPRLNPYPRKLSVALQETVKTGSEFMHVASGLIVAGQGRRTGNSLGAPQADALWARQTSGEERAALLMMNLRAAFDQKRPDKIRAILNASPPDAVPRKVADDLRRFAYFQELASKPGAAPGPFIIPSPDLPRAPTTAKERVAAARRQVRIATLAALARFGAVQDWAAPRLQAALASDTLAPDRRNEAHLPRDHRFRDAFGRVISLEEITDAYLLSVCAAETPRVAVSDFTAYVVAARGQTIGPPRTKEERLSAQHVVDSEGFRWDFDQLKTGQLGSNLTITGSYRAWADLDHFSQSLTLAQAWDGASGSLLFDEKERPLAGVSRNALKQAWSGNPFGETVSRLENLVWSGGKAIGTVHGSKVDLEQFEAGDRGVNYASQLRRGIVDKKRPFCAAVRDRSR